MEAKVGTRMFTEPHCIVGTTGAVDAMQLQCMYPPRTRLRQPAHADIVIHCKNHFGTKLLVQKLYATNFIELNGFG